MNIYVGNLPYAITEDELRDLFAQFGEISSAAIIKDKFSGQSKGFGFVEMPVQGDAEEAVKSLNDYAVKGRKLRVNEARPREQRPLRRSAGY